MENQTITSVFNATAPLAINAEGSITKTQVLFLYAVAAAAADRPFIPNVEEGPLPFTGVDEVAVPYSEVRNWLGQMLDANLLMRRVMPIPDGADFVREIKRVSYECSDAGLLELCVDDDTLHFTALGVEAIEKYGPVLDAEWLVIERSVLKIVNNRYGYCGIGVEECMRHVPTLNPRELKNQFVMVDNDLMAAVYRRTDGLLLVNVFGVGTFIVERLVAINPEVLATLADEGYLQRDTEETVNEYHTRFSALSKVYQREHGIPDDEEPAEVPEDNPMAALAAMLGKSLGKKVGPARIDIPKDGSAPTVADLDEKVEEAAVVMDAEGKPVS